MFTSISFKNVLARDKGQYNTEQYLYTFGIVNKTWQW